MHLFRFYVDEDVWLVMRFTKLLLHPHLLPKDKQVEHPWKEDANKNLRIPKGIPKSMPFKCFWSDEVLSTIGNQDKAKKKVFKALVKKSFTKGGIQGYIEF